MRLGLFLCCWRPRFRMRSLPLGGRAGQRAVLPEVPAFLSGPMGVLLTNAGGFSSQCVHDDRPGLPSQQLEVVTGQLLGPGDRLLFAPDPRSLDKRLRPIGLSYIWNVKDNRGCVLSETLQGWAPIGFGVHYTNVLSTRTDYRAGTSGGHSCTQESVQICFQRRRRDPTSALAGHRLKGAPCPHHRRTELGATDRSRSPGFAWKSRQLTSLRRRKLHPLRNRRPDDERADVERTQFEEAPD